ncbi:MAG TPA: hypothetical protein VK194_06490, partial [Candidatus Deferrimicrobium sp.]|nr:hypothetical protein [Candidatus Deferrimicrobium sp.]
MAGPSTADLDAVHARLKAILAAHRGDLAITADGPGGMTVEVPGLEGRPWGYVAGTRLGKRYVSLYLMPVYAAPELAATMSPELRARMQGKSCFNFARIDEPLLAELDALAARTIPGFRAVAERAAAGRVGARRGAPRPGPPDGRLGHADRRRRRPGRRDVGDRGREGRRGHDHGPAARSLARRRPEGAGGRGRSD